MNHLNLSKKVVFDYSILDFETRNEIIEKENTLVGIRTKYAKDVGKVFTEAQEVLSNNGNGTFENWYSSLGFKKQNVHNYMNIYKNVQTLDEPEKEVFESLTKSVQIEMSKPSANPKVNEAVFNGDIKSHKEYKALEKQLKEKEQELSALKKQPKPKPVVETKEVLKEVKPADYDSLKTDNRQLAERLKEVESNLKFTQQKYNLLEESTQEAKELEATIKRMKGEKNRFEAMFSLNDKTQAINDFFDKEMAAVRFKPLVDIVQSEKAFNDLRYTVNVVDQWVEEMQRILPDRYIREAEIIE